MAQSQTRRGGGDDGDGRRRRAHRRRPRRSCAPVYAEEKPRAPAESRRTSSHGARDGGRGQRRCSWGRRLSSSGTAAPWRSATTATTPSPWAPSSAARRHRSIGPTTLQT
uniref:Uncharacterized protein n=1 Tax=Oryza nivara TaxID=4536 RepID=A0A0E0GQW4_ORYNI